MVKFKSTGSVAHALNPQKLCIETALPAAGHWPASQSRRRICRRTAPPENEIMARFSVAIALVGMLAAPLLALSYGEAAAQQRSTCSQALAHCGKQRVCQRRFENCMETGCWTVVMVKRCGYEKR
jgi:hypothetical protein